MTEDKQTETKMIPIEKLEISELNPREDIGDLLGLTESVKTDGQYDPLKVRPIKDEKFEVFEGRRRLKAAQLANIEKLKCNIYQEKDDADCLLEIGVGDSTSKNFTPIEKAELIKKLKEKHKENKGKEISNAEIGRRFGLTGQRIGQIEKILEWPTKLHQALKKNTISEKQGRKIYKNRNQFSNLEKEIEWAEKHTEKSLEKRYKQEEKEKKITKSYNPTEYKKIIDDKKIQIDEQLKEGDTIIIKSKTKFKISKVKPDANYEIKEVD